MNVQVLTDINHGSAAVTTAALGLGQTLPTRAPGASVPGAIAENRATQSRMQPPSAARATRDATGSLGIPAIEYLSPSRVRQSFGAPHGVGVSPAASDLGQELSDDSLTVSPDQQQARGSGGSGALKRDSRARLSSGKRLAISASPSRTLRFGATPRGGSARKVSAANLWEPPSSDPPRDRGPPAVEERLAALEKAIKEQVQIGFELRRDIYGKFGTISDHMDTVKTQFAVVEAVLEEKVAAIDGQMEAMRRHLETAEASLPLDGALVKQGFAKL